MRVFPVLHLQLTLPHPCEGRKAWPWRTSVPQNQSIVTIRTRPCHYPRNEQNRRELITSVTAGKSFSLAANVQGQMFAWGTGWAGQLGLGVAKDSKVRRAH